MHQIVLTIPSEKLWEGIANVGNYYKSHNLSISQ